jgi:hypothetical protein
MRSFTLTLTQANVAYNVWSLISAQISDLYMANSPYIEKTPKFVSFSFPNVTANTGATLSLQDTKTGGEYNNFAPGGSFQPPHVQSFDLTQCQVVGTVAGNKVDVAIGK